MLNNLRILFLDFDGVVSSFRNQLAGMRFDPVALKMIENLQKELQFEIVIISEQRKLINDISEFKHHLKTQYGVDLKFHPSWKIDHHLHNEPPIQINQRYIDTYNLVWEDLSEENVIEKTKYWRGRLVNDWIYRHNGKPSKIEYVVLDDSYDLYPLNPNRVVRVEKGEEVAGLLAEHYDRVLEIYNNEGSHV